MPEAKQKNYPTQPDSDGFYFQDEGEETAGILTRDYENGSAIKKAVLKSGATAIIRKLKGRDFVETKKQIQSDNTLDAETIGMSLAIEIDGEKQPPEYYLDDLFQGDYVTLLVAYGGLNL